MPLTEKKIRTILRWTHIVLGLVIMCYVYSPFHTYAGFRLFVKFFAVPVIALTGLWIWKFKPLNKFFGIRL